MDDIETKLYHCLRKLTNNEEYILGVLDNAPCQEDREYICRYIEAHGSVTISEIILLSCELGMIRDGELEPME